MKTTIDLSDDLLVEAKATAARRGTTLKVMVEHALRREIRGDLKPSDKETSFTIDVLTHGFSQRTAKPGLPALLQKTDLSAFLVKPPTSGSRVEPKKVVKFLKAL